MATYYVRASGGSDGNDGLSFANAWATVQYGLDTITAGSTLLICADGVHTPTAQLDFDNPASDIYSPYVIKGASALGVDDGTMATISGSSLPGGTDLAYMNTAEYYIIKNLRFTAATRYNLQIGSGFTTSVLLYNCRFDNAANSGVRIATLSYYKTIKLIGCEVDHNGNSGITNGGNSDCGADVIVNCSIHNNTGHGIYMWSTINPCFISGNRIYRNTTSGYMSNGSCTGYTLSNNVFFANGANGIYISNVSTSGFIVYNNIIKSNGAYGLEGVLASANQINLLDYNCSYGNTSGHTNLNGGVLPGSHNIIQDPLFTNETIGAEDFSLQAGSPCLNVGIGYSGV